MSDKINEQLSALLDDETNDPDRLVKKLSADSDMIECWRRYTLISDVIAGQQNTRLDISARVSAAIEDEPAIFAPIHKKQRSPRIRSILKQSAGLAIAATVSAVAVLTVQQNRLESPNAAVTVAVAPAGAQATPQLAASTGQPVTRVKYVTSSNNLDNAVQNKLSNYIVNHNEYSVASNIQGVMPYVRIVSTTPGQRVMVRSANEK